MNTLRILHIITDLGVGGAEIMLLKLLSAIDRARAEPAVISLMGGDKAAELAPSIEALGIDVVTLGMRRIPNPLTMVRLAQRVRHFQPDVVQTWMYHADLLGGLVARMAAPAPLVWGLHNSDLDKNRTKRSTRAVARACAALSHRLPEKIVTCSEAAAHIHKALGYDGEKFIVVPNGIDTNAFRPNKTTGQVVRQELGFSDKTMLVGLVARFDPQKDHRNFVEAAAIIGKHNLNAHFLLAGAGCDQANRELIGWVAETGIAERFHLLGKRRDIPRVTAALDVAVTSSAYGEAFPLVIGEAMSTGVPCVVTDIGDSALIVGDTGRVVPPHNPVALAEGVSRILALPQTERHAMGAAAHERILSNFSLPSIAARYLALYEALGKECVV